MKNKTLPMMVLLLALTLFPVVAFAASTKPGPQTPIAIIEDNTSSAGCVHQYDDGPQEACPPGSVIIARESTYSEVIQKQSPYYVILTGNKTNDQRAIELLADQLHNELTPQASSEASCTPRPKSMSGSYSVNGRRVYYSVTYTVNSNCSVTNIRDMSRVTGWPTLWTKSCSNGLYNCSTRAIILGSNWSSSYSLPNAYINNQYRHWSFSLVNAYGYQYFGN